jgi:magnesium-transporting ATPase (P-type)
MSPDSIELVKSAREQGFALTESGQSSIKRIKLGNGEEVKNLERLQLIEFNSDRKRETVIMRDGNYIKLYCKGADSVIETLLSKDTRPEILNQCKNYVNKFSAQGFRTLFVAMKVLTEDEYQRFAEELNKANLELDDKDRKVAEVYKTVENNLFLIGTTIVEDKLQDKVPETIRDLRMAGVKIWMLTGDKMNTAYNIGLSCNLISKDMKTFNICGIEVKKK